MNQNVKIAKQVGYFGCDIQKQTSEKSPKSKILKLRMKRI